MNTIRSSDKNPERILLSVIGLTPQVITETVYALAQQKPPWYPTHIRAITTTEGRAVAEEALFGRGKMAELRRQYPKIPPISFVPDDIHVVKCRKKPIDDIRTPEHSAALADFITQEIMEITDDPSNELHVSLAGGRKTMSFLAGYGLSLFGRDQDRLSHVLVSKPFESRREFFFPTTEKCEIAIPDQEKPADARDAKVTLADVPFVRLEKIASVRILARMVGYEELCKALEQKPHLEIDLERDKFIFSRYLELEFTHQRLDDNPKFEPLPAALYACFAERAAKGQPFISLDELAAKQQPLLDFYDHISEREDRTGEKSKSSLETAKSKVGAVLGEFLKELASTYEIAAEGQNPIRYGLRLEPDQITIRGKQ